MKHFKYYFIVLIAASFLLAACEKDDNELPQKDRTEETNTNVTNDNSITFRDIVGVWKEDNEYLTEYSIISIDKDGFFCGVLALNKTLLSGIITLDEKNATTFVDDYTFKPVKITIQKYDNSKLYLILEYTSYGGTDVKQSIKYTKLSPVGTNAQNPLIGRTITNASNYTETIYTRVETRYSGLQSKNSLFTKGTNTRMIHYVLINNIAYFQSKQYEYVATSKFSFTSDRILWASIDNQNGEIQWNPKGYFSEY